MTTRIATRLLARIAVSCALCAPAARAADPPVWDVSEGNGKALFWRIPTGWQSGSLTPAGDKLLVGYCEYADKQREDLRAVLACLSIQTGEPIWKLKHDHLPHRTNDIPNSPIGSVPAIDGGRAFYISNRGELCCVELAEGKRVWTIDMPADLGIFKRDVNDCGSLVPSAIVLGDFVYCVTGNGIGDNMRTVPAPEAPSFLAVDKHTGRVVWSSNAPGGSIHYGQWSTPAVATVDGVEQILFPGGDGLLYSFEPRTGKLLWQVDCRGSHPLDDRDFVVAPPLVVGEMAYVSLSQDFELSGRSRPIVAIDLKKHAVAWSYRHPDFHCTFGPMALDKGLLYAAGMGGLVVALDAASGKEVWHQPLEDHCHSGVCLHAGRVYVATEVGSVLVFAAPDGKPLGRFDTGDFLLRATPVISGGRLFVLGCEYAWALRLPE